MFGPVEAGGLTWFPVYGTSLSGWLGAESEAAFQVATANCPDELPVTLGDVAAMAPGDRVACFEDTPITLEGPVAVSGLGGSVRGTWEPAWLASPIRTFIGEHPEQLDLSVSPGVTLPEGSDVTVRLEIIGHFDDPAADDCQVTSEGADAPEDAAAVKLYCRTVFVVTSFTELE